MRLTDDDADSNDPQWSADGATVAYSANALGGKDLLVQRTKGGNVARARDARRDTVRQRLAARRQRAARHGGGAQRLDILVQPANGSTAWPYAATRANEIGRARFTRRTVGRVHVRRVGARRGVSRFVPASRTAREASRRTAACIPSGAATGASCTTGTTGRWSRCSSTPTASDATPAVGERTTLFRAPYHAGSNTMYDVSPDGKRFVIVVQPGNEPASW